MYVHKTVITRANKVVVVVVDMYKAKKKRILMCQGFGQAALKFCCPEQVFLV